MFVSHMLEYFQGKYRIFTTLRVLHILFFIFSLQYYYVMQEDNVMKSYTQVLIVPLTLDSASSPHRTRGSSRHCCAPAIVH